MTLRSVDQNFRSAGSTRLPAVQLGSLFEDNRAGQVRGIYAVCSANRIVLEAAFAQAVHDGSPVLIEATSNQVNQEGGYTGMTPAQFRDYVHGIAREAEFPLKRLILGGDHLGPNPWRKQSAASAMEKACAMVAAYAEAGFGKIHLDASMACADDPRALNDETIAERAVQLCKVAEAHAPGDSGMPVYIIGTEVPVPGGASEEMDIEVTSTANLKRTLDVHREAFTQAGLEDAWERVVGVVTQPGVEFNDEAVAEYVPEKAQELSHFILEEEKLVYEAHSTDYQSAASLRRLVRDHFAILKVGPELTFVMREAVFALARIEEELIDAAQCSHLRAVVERTMVEHPAEWQSYYRGDEVRVRVERAFALSDRIRYYWPHNEIAVALETLIRNLKANPAPLPVVAQYLPRQAEAIRSGIIENDPSAMIRNRIRESLCRYAEACGLASGD